MVAVDEVSDANSLRFYETYMIKARKELVVGIIDVVRTYTWDKKLESWIKGIHRSI